MIQTIRAEFNSVEAAEAAASRINLSVQGIRKINIPNNTIMDGNSSQKFSAISSSSNPGTFFPFSISSMYHPMQLMFTGKNKASNNNIEQNDDDTLPLSNSCELIVTCEGYAVKQVEQLMIAMGGLSLRTY